MEYVVEIFGSGKELNALQMSCRGIVIFIIALILIRISGRRSFGQSTPADNIISILLGAILSRAVTGVSPFIPVIAVCFVIVILHRLFLLLMVRNPKFQDKCEGKKILLFEKNNFVESNLNRALVSKEDVLQSLRRSTFSDDLDSIDKIYMERNGKISILKKKI